MDTNKAGGEVFIRELPLGPRVPQPLREKYNHMAQSISRNFQSLRQMGWMGGRGLGGAMQLNKSLHGNLE